MASAYLIPGSNHTLCTATNLSDTLVEMGPILPRCAYRVLTDCYLLSFMTHSS